MNATVTYSIDRRTSEWYHNDNVEAWFLVKTTTPDYGNAICEEVAVFHSDSEAETFIAWP